MMLLGGDDDDIINFIVGIMPGMSADKRAEVVEQVRAAQAAKNTPALEEAKGDA